MHFDDRMKGKVHTTASLSIELHIPYPTLAGVLTERRFAPVFDRNLLGGLCLSGEIPEFLVEFIDFETPYKPEYHCDEPSHTHTTVTAQNGRVKTAQPKKHNAEYIEPKLIRKYLSDEQFKVFTNLLEGNYHKPTGKDDPYWEWVNFTNTLSVVLALLINKDPEAKLAELVTEPEVFNEKAPNLVKNIRAAYEESTNVTA
jgi:hypothetical protein